VYTVGASPIEINVFSFRVTHHTDVAQMIINQTAILIALVLPAGLLQPGGTSAGAPADQIRITADLIKQRDTAETQEEIPNRQPGWYSLLGSGDQTPGRIVEVRGDR
jgi:hypothetical protein